MRGHAQDVGEQAQQVKWAQPGLARAGGECDRPMRVGVDPKRRLYSPAPVARDCVGRSALLSGGDFEVAVEEQQPNFIEPDIAAARGGDRKSTRLNSSH